MEITKPRAKITLKQVHLGAEQGSMFTCLQFTEMLGPEAG